MDLLSILLIAVGLSPDCFAVALSSSIAIQRFSYFQLLRISFAFGFFQFLMPILGWLAGQTIIEIIAQYDHWVALVLLTAVGARMIWEATRSGDSRTQSTDVTKGVVLLTLSVATSIDALAVGLSFAFLEIDIMAASITIGIVTFLITGIGFLLGRKVGSVIGKRAKLVGGVILIGIGLRIVLTHIL